ncbi:MAG TPA: response regulator transcription factor [Xanthobacteraceae bacterium]|jgi:DNA-binding NarL/FixJ family response regulator
MTDSVQRALIVDEHPVVRQGLRYVLENTDDLSFCGGADTVAEARTAIARLRPDVLICEISFRRLDGIELVRQMRAHYPRLPILVLSTLDETIYAQRMLALGVGGYIMKEASTELLLTALRAVLEGNVYVSDPVGSSMLSRFAGGASQLSADPMERLSNRELQVLHLIGKGSSTREAAQLLNLSIKTVESHRQRIKRKLNLTTGIQLLRYAVLSQGRTLDEPER